VNLLKGRIAALCVVGLALGSGLLGYSSPQVQQSFSEPDSKKPQDQRSASSNTANSTKDTNSAPESRAAATEENAPASTASPVSVSQPETVVASGSLPAGYALDENCEKGIGQTGLDIYYLLPPVTRLGMPVFTVLIGVP
jgi:cytoskeletal protein RodZ